MSVEAMFNYPCRDPSGAHPKTNKTGDGDPTKETMVTKEVQMSIHNARLAEEPKTLDKNGFQMVAHETEVDFDKLEDIQNIYIPQMEELVKRHTGAESCILFDHTIRRVKKAGTAAGYGTAPTGGFVDRAVNKVHGDYTTIGGPRRVLELAKPTESGSFGDTPPLTEAQAEEIVAKRRFLIVNVWRNISRTTEVKRMPLAMVDCATVAPDDLFVVDLVFKDRVGLNLALDQKKEHRWCYFPDMVFNEAILFKTHDNTTDKNITGRECIHSAFDDPTTKDEDPARESIEVRVLAIMPEESKAEPPMKRMRSSGGFCSEPDHA